jgi:uncharacterized delta-60 repeat protein
LAGYTTSFGVGRDDFWLIKLKEEVEVSEPVISEEWNKTFGGSSSDFVYSVEQTSDGGYVLGGFTRSFGAGDYDFWLVKSDSSGNHEWNQTFGGFGPDKAYSVHQTSNGGYVIAGQTRSHNLGSKLIDFYLVKTNSLGNLEWYKTFGGSGWDYSESVQQTSDGGYVLAGCTSSFGSGGYDFWLVKTDSSGSQEWYKAFGGSEYDFAYFVQQTSDGGYVLAGYTSSFGSGGYDFWLVKTDPLGNHEWNRTFGGLGNDYAYSVQQTSDGGYVLAGYTRSFGSGSSDFWLVKTDPLGNHEWNRTFGGSGSDYAYSVQQTSDGGYVITGSTYSFGAGSYDIWIVKVDSLGNHEWNKTFGGSSSDYAYSVQQTSDGGYIVGGYTYSFGSGGFDSWLIKVNATITGEEPEEEIPKIPSEEEVISTGIPEDISTNVYVEQIPILYVDEFANIKSGFISLRVW